MGKKVEKIEKICPNCNKEFEVRPCEDKRMICCSMKCSSEYRSEIKKCIYCGNRFKVPKSRADNAKFCSNDCKKQYNYERSLELRICHYCNKEYKVQKSSHDVYCSPECQEKYNSEHCKVLYNCDYCGKEFEISRYRIINNTTGVYCSHKCSTDVNTNGLYLKCENCGKDIYKQLSNVREHNFCSNGCTSQYYHKINSQEKICLYCNKKYIVKNSHAEQSRFCSNICKNKWQSESLKGENNPQYKRIKTNCIYCGKEIYLKPYRFKNQNKFLCSYECRDKYFSIAENRTLKQKIATMKLSRMAIKTTKNIMSSPHKIINTYLEKENIIYRNEELIKYYKMDIYLPDYNLGIEINGDFWHCSPIRYSEVQYERQLKTVWKDKSKHAYTKNKYGYEILYLWEHDIKNNLKVCEKLIQEYIKKNGVLKNYHSFNYFIDECGELKLNKNIIIPYQEYNKNDLPINLKDKVS